MNLSLVQLHDELLDLGNHVDTIITTMEQIVLDMLWQEPEESPTQPQKPKETKKNMDKKIKQVKKTIDKKMDKLVKMDIPRDKKLKACAKKMKPKSKKK